jgi:hypothetical protein
MVMASIGPIGTAVLVLAHNRRCHALALQQLQSGQMPAPPDQGHVPVVQDCPLDCQLSKGQVPDGPTGQVRGHAQLRVQGQIQARLCGDDNGPGDVRQTGERREGVQATGLDFHIVDLQPCQTLQASSNSRQGMKQDGPHRTDAQQWGVGGGVGNDPGASLFRHARPRRHKATVTRGVASDSRLLEYSVQQVMQCMPCVPCTKPCLAAKEGEQGVSCKVNPS